MRVAGVQVFRIAAGCNENLRALSSRLAPAHARRCALRGRGVGAACTRARRCLHEGSGVAARRGARRASVLAVDSALCLQLQHPVRSIDGTLALEVIGALIAAALVARLVGHAATAVACRMLNHARGQRASAAQHRTDAARHLRAPLAFALAIGLWQAALGFVDLSYETRDLLHDVARAGFVVALAWLMVRLIDLGSDLIERRTHVFAHHEMSHALLPLARRVAKVVIGAVAVVALLGSLGYSVTGLVAGLGITGIAVALAAQKTLENVLGAFALGIDQPLREGDLVKVDQTLGTVERIGLRSTRLRTLDRTLVAYPNGKLADSVIERYSARDRLRFDVHFRLGLATTGAQLRDIRARIDAMLAEHPSRAGDPPSVHLTGPGDTWFDLEVMAWFDAPDWAAFQSLRDQLLLDCLDIIAGAGAVLSGAPVPAAKDAAAGGAAPHKPADREVPRSPRTARSAG
jgi:MscS family membrane protein